MAVVVYPKSETHRLRYAVLIMVLAAASPSLIARGDLSPRRDGFPVASNVLATLLDKYTDRVDQAAEEIGAFFDHLRLVGVRGLVAENLNDPEYLYRPEPTAEPTDQPLRTGSV